MVKCEICGVNYDDRVRTFWIQYSSDNNDKKCTCRQCWDKETKLKPYHFQNHIPNCCTGGDLCRHLFDTKEDLLKFILDDTNDGYVACMCREGNEIVDVGLTCLDWWVRGYATLDKGTLPYWEDKVTELCGLLT